MVSITLDLQSYWQFYTLKTRVHESAKNVATTLKFQTPERRQEAKARSILMTHKD